MSFLTCFWLLPQKEHFSRSPPSPMRATTFLLIHCDHHPSASRTVPRPSPIRGRDTVSLSAGGERRGALERLEHGVDQAVLDRALGGEDLVALDVAADLLHRPPRVVADHLLEQLAHPQDLVGLDLDVRALAEGTPGVGLVDQDPAVR